MNKVAPTAISYSKNLNFTFSNTLRGEKINLNNYSTYNFIIDVDGTVYQGSNANEDNANVCIIGGLNKFVNSKANTIYNNYFITEQQKVTLYKVIKDLSNFTDSATITASSDKLEQALTALYSNYCG
jgi:hypothetical protein